MESVIVGTLVFGLYIWYIILKMKKLNTLDGVKKDQNRYTQVFDELGKCREILQNERDNEAAKEKTRVGS